MVPYSVTAGTGYTVRGRYGDEIHMCETTDQAYCCDRGCAWRYMIACGVPAELRNHPYGYGAGEFIDLRNRDIDDMDAPVWSWGEAPCTESSEHEYCPACGALTIEGIETDREPLSYVDPDPVMNAS